MDFKKIFSASGGNTSQRITLCLKVKAQMILKDFKVEDQNGDICDFEIISKNPQLVKMVKVGRKLRVIFPELDVENNKIKVVDKTKIYINKVADKQDKYMIHCL